MTWKHLFMMFIGAGLAWAGLGLNRWQTWAIILVASIILTYFT
jgi:hypothetical protein